MKNNKDYLDKIITIIDKPYFFEMENYGIRDKREQVYVLCKIYDNNIRINGKSIYDSKGNQIYYEFIDGDWSKYEYDSNSNLLYAEYSDGKWVKREYNSIGKRTYYETSDGYIINNR